MLPPSTLRRPQSPGSLLLILMCALMVCWGINVRIASYRSTASNIASLARSDRDIQKGRSLCEAHRSLSHRPRAEPETLALPAVSSSPFPIDRAQQVSGEVRSTLLFYPSVSFFRPPPTL
jgi:hypothetical protein